MVRVSEEESVSVRGKKLQVTVNDALRMLSGVHRRDRVKLADLREAVTIPTVNYVVARDAAMAAWWALASPKGSPLTPILEGLRPDSRTRGASGGQFRMPKDSRNIFVGNMVKLWNTFPALSAAKTPSMAANFVKTKMKNALPV